MPEMQAPKQIQFEGLGDYLEVMSKVVPQSGMSNKIVESKWPGIRDGFHRSDVAKIVGMSPGEIDQLTRDPRVIGNWRKLEAVVSNS